MSCVFISVLIPCAHTQLCLCRYFHDDTVAARNTWRSYATRTDVSYTISLNRWAKFLNGWTVKDMDAAGSMLECECEHELGLPEWDVLKKLRSFADVLFLKADDELSVFYTF